MRNGASEEWMAAIPNYTKIMQRLLGFEGDHVETIFMGIQIYVGAPPEFMDFRFEVQDATHGSFHLDHCGALMDVEPMGDEYVRSMCHDIEDPTFDATAAATNPRAQVRPVHRPPRLPADRTPHCAWTVTIVEDAEPLPFPEQAARLARSNAARLPIATRPSALATDDGWADYRGPLDPDLVLERFSSATLAALMDEVCLQGHLLSRAFMVQVAERAGGSEAAAIGTKQLCGIAGLTAKRLAAALGAGPDLEGVASVLAVHPMFLPRSYVDLGLELVEGALMVSLARCPATEEDDGLTWPALLVDESDRGLRAAVQCVAPQAQVARADATTWRIEIDPEAPPAPEPDEVLLTEFSTGALFSFERRG
jgi:hypothetical protein